MTYILKLYVPDDTQPAQRQAAERLFRQALEGALGDAAMVVPVYSAYLNIVGQHGEVPDTEALTVDERLVLGKQRHVVDGFQQFGRLFQCCLKFRYHHPF